MKRLLNGRLRYWHRKEGSSAGADDIRVVNIGLGVAEDQPVHTRCIGGAENSPQVARLFNRFEILQFDL
jgi:hypothetical protein